MALGNLAVRVYLWIAPSQVMIDAETMHVRLARPVAKALAGAGKQAAERRASARRALIRELQLRELADEEVRRELDDAARESDELSKRALPGQIPWWRILRRRAAHRDAKALALRHAALNETQSECGVRLHRSADCLSAALNALVFEPTSAEVETPRGAPSAARAEAAADFVASEPPR
jgi:hypothetical protein